ncbi:MAG: glycosyltransferase family 2 protein [Bacteroidales bacterium]|nr:glycosyltransferase family 2 protein [Bacteroidales bacterium]MDT8431303.1 glycosyltransferase family 2 protein [Bacteroidales bacterium]
MDISLVIPLLNEAESLNELNDWIHQVMTDHAYSYELIMIDDGSTDGSWEKILELKERNPSVKGVKFRRNYGKSAALQIGFQMARGEVVVTMDADLQDNPEEIPEMRRMILEEGYDLVSGWKKKRYDPVLSKNLPSKLFNWAARSLSGIRLHDFNCGLKAYRNAVIKGIEVYGEMHRYIPVLAKSSGFPNIGEKVVQHQERKYGVTKFGMERFINGFLDLLSVSFVTRFAKKPMHLFGMIGTLMFFLGFVALLIIGIQKWYALRHQVHGSLVADNVFFYIALTCMIIGSQLFIGGFLGELVSRSASDRNHYQIEDEC